MSSPKTLARVAGSFYLLMFVCSLLAGFVRSRQQARRGALNLVVQPGTGPAGQQNLPGRVPAGRSPVDSARQARPGVHRRARATVSREGGADRQPVHHAMIAHCTIVFGVGLWATMPASVPLSGAGMSRIGTAQPMRQ